jgi:hypothetical protein
MPTLRTVPDFVLRGLGLVNGVMREMGHVRYQFTAPFIMDASATESAFHLHATPLDDALRVTIAAA